MVEMTTNRINGYIKAILIKSESMQSLGLKISLSTLPSFAIFNEVDIRARKLGPLEMYVPLKVDSYNANTHDYNAVADSWVINEQLLVLLTGEPNTNFEVRIRYAVN